MLIYQSCLCVMIVHMMHFQSRYYTRVVNYDDRIAGCISNWSHVLIRPCGLLPILSRRCCHRMGKILVWSQLVNVTSVLRSRTRSCLSKIIAKLFSRTFRWLQRNKFLQFCTINCYNFVQSTVQFWSHLNTPKTVLLGPVPKGLPHLGKQVSNFVLRNCRQAGT